MNNFYNYNPYSFNRDSFIGYYVSDYSEVLNTAVPTDGSAVLFADLSQGLIWSKKLVGNTPCVQAYRITPLYQQGEETPAPVNNKVDIAEEIKAIKAELAALRGGNDDTK